MTYTLAMAVHPKIEIKEDGVAEVAMTDARAALTSLIREAMIVPTEFYEQALRDRAIIDELHRRTETPGAGATSYDEVKSRTIREAIHAAALAVDS